jgi:hypothetical protein
MGPTFRFAEKDRQAAEDNRDCIFGIIRLA